MRALLLSEIALPTRGGETNRILSDTVHLIAHAEMIYTCTWRIGDYGDDCWCLEGKQFRYRFKSRFDGLDDIG